MTDEYFERYKQQLLNELKEYLDEKLKKVYVGNEQMSVDKGVCFTTSILACKILRRLNYKCEVARIEVLYGDEIGKQVFFEQMKTGKFSSDEVVSRGGWSIGLGVGGQHYVVKNEDEIMDLTFGQGSRPEHNIITMAYWEKVNNLPKCIFGIRFLQRDLEWEKNTLYYSPELKEYFKEVINEGYKKLKKRWKK